MSANEHRDCADKYYKGEPISVWWYVACGIAWTFCMVLPILKF